MNACYANKPHGLFGNVRYLWWCFAHTMVLDRVVDERGLKWGKLATKLGVVFAGTRYGCIDFCRSRLDTDEADEPMLERAPVTVRQVAQLPLPSQLVSEMALQRASSAHARCAEDADLNVDLIG